MVQHPKDSETNWNLFEYFKLKKAVYIYSWFDGHERLQKLHQQAILEARELREESVKEMMISYNKVSTGFICTNIFNICTQNMLFKYINIQKYMMGSGEYYGKLGLSAHTSVAST
jgi:hypothetical protein